LHQPGVIEVAGVGSRRQSDGRLYAPGAEVLTLLPGGRYDFASGASLATAHVTGAVALILALNPTMKSTAVRDLFAKTSEPFAGVDGSASGDAVDACAALVAATGRGLCKHYEPRQDRVADRATTPLATR
jgi:subtilisin family serine protease